VNIFGVSGCPGAFGMAFDPSGNLYVVDQPTGSIYKFPPGGGVANASTLLVTEPVPVLDEIRFDSSGNLYGGLNADNTGNFANGSIIQIDPSTGATLRTVVSGLDCSALFSIDPLSGDFFTDDNCSGEDTSSALTRIMNPAGASPTASLYATLPNNPDGSISFAPNGTIYVDSANQVAEVSGTNGPATPTVTTLPNQPWYGLGLLAQGPAGGAAQFLISGFNQVGSTPGGIGTFDLTNPAVPQSSTLVNTSSQPVEMIIGPDGCLYAARGVAVFRITDTSGACAYAAANSAPSLYLAPIGISPNPPQGSSQSFTVSVHYATVPDGTPVVLSVSGANARILQSNTVGGIASFSYTGAHQGVDTMVASATISNSSVVSNNSVVTWGSGTDVTFLTLNQSPSGGTTGQATTLIANLTDVSTNPPTALSGQQVNFSLGGANCGGQTDSNGNASCQATPGGTGSITLSANFAGTSQYNASSDSRGFDVLAPTPTPTVAQTATPSPTPSPAPTPTPTPRRTPTPTRTPVPTATPTRTATRTPVPTATRTPLPTATRTPLPTATRTPVPTATRTPIPTATRTPVPTPTPIATSKIGPIFAAPLVLDFGSCLIGERGAIDVALLANPIWNNGPALISSIAIQGSTDFSIVPGYTTCKSTLGVGQICAIAVQFNPLGGGPRQGRLVIQDNALDSPQEVILNGQVEFFFF
jgi:hypothetical protein